MFDSYLNGNCQYNDDCPNSRARKEGKKRREAKGKYGGMMVIIAPNSRARKEGKKTSVYIQGTPKKNVPNF